MKQSRTKLIAAILIAAGLIGFSSWAVISNQQPERTETVQTAPQTEAPATGRTEVTYTAISGIASLEQLKKEAESVVIKETEYGALIDSIEGHTSGTDGKYWSFYVNGEMAQMGADSYVQKEGDIIEWKFQKL